MTIENEKVVGGISCSEVLDRLSEYVDGELPESDRSRVETHLRGCDACARFGGEFRSTIRALREHLARGGELPARVREALHRAIDSEPRRN